MVVALVGGVLAAQHLSVYRVGAEKGAAARWSTGYLLAGGGATPAEAYKWLATKAAGGDAVVLRASSADAMNAVLVKAGPLNSVTTFVIKSREAASERPVVDAVRGAELLWFAGGDQWNYVRMWKGTPLGAAIQERITAGVPVGGSSAGLAIMGEHGFSAEFDTVRSPEALKDPFDKRVAIESDFLKIPLLAGIITDTHFAKRDRMGRLLAFLARLGGKASAIAVDEGSAVMLEADGAASLSGDGHAYFLRPTRAADVSAPGKPLTIADVEVYRIGSKGRFNIKSWKGEAGIAYELSVREGAILSSQDGGAVY